MTKPSNTNAGVISQQTRKTLKPALLTAAVASLMGLSGQVIAQDSMSLEEVVVTGIRSSLTDAAEIKRSASGVVDAISAEDMGKFPDTNLAESLQRITGVSIDRQNGEGNQIAVRGFGPSFNMVTLNGRQMPATSSPKQEGASTSEQSRAFNFAEIAAESVSGVEVYKTGKAHTATGGIGATVNIKTARPFDNAETTGAFNIKAINDTSVEVGDDFTPELGGLFSTQFADGMFGFLVNGSYSERHNREDLVTTDGWIRSSNPASPDTNRPNIIADPNLEYVWTPRNIVVDQSDHERTRENAQVVLQFAPSDAITATLDYTVSNFEDNIERSQSAVWFDTPTTGNADANGTVTNPTVTSVPANGLGAVDFNGYTDIIETENDSLGFNLEIKPTDALTLELDVHSSTSEAQGSGQSSDFLVILAGPLGTSYTANFTDGVPTLTLDDSALTAAGSSYDDVDALRPNIDLARGNRVVNDVDQAQFRASYEFDDSVLTKVEAGFAATDYKIDTTFVFDLNVQGTPPCGTACSDLVTVENSQRPDIIPTIVTYNAAQVFSALQGPFPSVFSQLTETQNVVEEEATAFYLQAHFENEIGDMVLNTTVGARYEETDVTGTTIQGVPRNLIWISPTELRAQNSDPIPFSIENSYDNFLPNIDFNLNVTDELVARLSYSKTMTRNNLNALRPALAITDTRPSGPYNAVQGNPGLIPYESDNIDLSIEYYYSEGSYASIGYFKKDVDNYIVQSTTSAPILGADGYNLTDPNPTNDATFPANTIGTATDQEVTFQITTPANGESASVDGIEVAVQHLFGESGFGLQANATFVSGDVEYDVRSVAQSVSLTGLSDSANLVGFYEADNYQVRLAYNWRDEFLLATGQLRQTEEPTFTEEYGQWDLSASYDINESLSITFDAINITEEDTQRHGRFDNQFLYDSKGFARYSVGLRASF